MINSRAIFLERAMLVRFYFLPTCILALFLAAPVVQAQSPISKSILISRSGTQPGVAANNTSSIGTGISDDGRYSIYRSVASDMDPNTLDTNSVNDAVVFDRKLSITKIISKRAAAPRTSGNGESLALDISADGRYILFLTVANNLLDVADANGQSIITGQDLYLYDQQLDVLKLVNRSRTSVNPSTSNAGVYGAGLTNRPLISNDGEWVAFVSEATDLVPTVTVGSNQPQLYLYQTSTETIRLLTTVAGSSTVAANASANAVDLLDISANAEYMLIKSNAGNLLDGAITTTGPDALFLIDRTGGSRSLVSHVAGNLSQACSNAALNRAQLNDDGSQVAFVSNCSTHVAGVTDTNNSSDVFRYFRATGAIQLISHRWLQPLVAANSLSSAVNIALASNDILFASNASDLTPTGVDTNGGSDIFLSPAAGAPSLISANTAGNSSNGQSFISFDSISDDGRMISFVCRGSDLLQNINDDNGEQDVFLRDVRTSTTYLVSYRGSDRSRTAQGFSGLSLAGMTPDGSSFIFGSTAPVVDPNHVDSNGLPDAHLAVEADSFGDGFDSFNDGFE